MIEHVVLFKFDESQPVEVKTIVDDIHALEIIPGVVDVKIGKTFTTQRNNGYTHALSTTLRSKEDLAVYAGHPLHLKVVEKIKNNIKAKDGIIALDFVHDADRPSNSFLKRKDTPWKLATCALAVTVIGMLCCTGKPAECSMCGGH